MASGRMGLFFGPSRAPMSAVVVALLFLSVAEGLAAWLLFEAFLRSGLLPLWSLRSFLAACALANLLIVAPIVVDEQLFWIFRVPLQHAALLPVPGACRGKWHEAVAFLQENDANSDRILR